jgi:hypothetical protein
MLYHCSKFTLGLEEYRFELNETAVYSFHASNNNYILFDINSLRALIIHIFYINFMAKDSFVNIKSFAN